MGRILNCEGTHCTNTTIKGYDFQTTPTFVELLTFQSIINFIVDY